MVNSCWPPLNPRNRNWPQSTWAPGRQEYPRNAFWEFVLGGFGVCDASDAHHRSFCVASSNSGTTDMTLRANVGAVYSPPDALLTWAGAKMSPVPRVCVRAVASLALRFFSHAEYPA